MKSQARISGSSIYPAVQNIILACRALGLGTVLTTIHMFFEDEVKAILGLPPEVKTFALMPIGYPQGKFGPIKRRPVSEVAYLDSYGAIGRVDRANPRFSNRLVQYLCHSERSEEPRCPPGARSTTRTHRLHQSRANQRRPAQSSPDNRAMSAHVVIETAHHGQGRPYH